MNRSKKMIASTAVVVALFSFSSISAQMRDTAAMRQRQEQMMQKMKTDLHFNQVQSDSMTAIQKEFNPRMRDIFMDQSASQDDRRAKISALRDERDKRVQAALGNDMYKKYQDWMQTNRPQRGGGGGGGNR